MDIQSSEGSFPRYAPHILCVQEGHIVARTVAEYPEHSDTVFDISGRMLEILKYIIQDTEHPKSDLSGPFLVHSRHFPCFRHFNFDVTGNYLLVGNHASDRVVAFRCNILQGILDWSILK